MSEKDEMVQEIGSLLLHDNEIMSRSWQHLVLVVQITNESTSANGFVYLSDGKAIPTSPDNFEIIDKFEELRNVMSEEETELWSACLLRIGRESRKISIDFEYDHPEKWLISPANVKEMAEKLRPTE